MLRRIFGPKIKTEDNGHDNINIPFAKQAGSRTTKSGDSETCSMHGELRNLHKIVFKKPGGKKTTCELKM